MDAVEGRAATVFGSLRKVNFCELPIGTVCVADVYDITEAVKDICERNGLPYIDVRIKWQNDLYLNGFKVGGVLCTSNYKSKKFNVSAGNKTFLGSKFYSMATDCISIEIKVVVDGDGDHNTFRAFTSSIFGKWHAVDRVIVQEKNEDKVVEHVVTVQVWQIKSVSTELILGRVLIKFA
ncbi:hypothetical protein Lal_00001635 [Lupinus albus]|nr:hypothetical protein Lal_00001635 [Lupinus albus]